MYFSKASIYPIQQTHIQSSQNNITTFVWPVLAKTKRNTYVQQYSMLFCKRFNFIHLSANDACRENFITFHKSNEARVYCVSKSYEIHVNTSNVSIEILMHYGSKAWVSHWWSSALTSNMAICCRVKHTQLIHQDKTSQSLREWHPMHLIRIMLYVWTVSRTNPSIWSPYTALVVFQNCSP